MGEEQPKSWMLLWFDRYLCHIWKPKQANYAEKVYNNTKSLKPGSWACKLNANADRPTNTVSNASVVEGSFWNFDLLCIHAISCLWAFIR